MKINQKGILAAFHLLLAAGLVAQDASDSTGAEDKPLDLRDLAKNSLPAVYHLRVFDSNGDQKGAGTGFLVSEKGDLVTNWHVIDDAAFVLANADNGGSFRVSGIVAADEAKDLAIVQIAGKDLPFLEFADSEKVEIGQRIIVIGSPLSLAGTVTEGIVSALRGKTRAEKARAIQISAPISPGSSGSPVLDSHGKVIGVAYLQHREGQNLNFAIPSKSVQKLLAKAAGVAKVTPFQPSGGLVAMPQNLPESEQVAWTTVVKYLDAGDSQSGVSQLQFLSSRVDYFGEGYVDHAAIEKDLTDYQAEWTTRTHLVLSKPKLKPLGNGKTRVEVTVRHYCESAQEQKTLWTDEFFEVQIDGDQGKIVKAAITSVRDSVIQGKGAPRIDAPIVHAVKAYLIAGDSGAPVEEEIKFYAPKVDYFDKGLVDHKFIWKDQQDYRKRWPNRKHTLQGEVKVNPEADGKITATVKAKFDISSQSKRVKVAGTSHFIFEIRGGEPKITKVWLEQD